MSNIDDLRRRLFESIDAVKDGSMSIETAKSINELSKSIIDTARVEVDLLETIGGKKSDFIEPPEKSENLPSGIASITQHRIGG